jgi:hypothetical protein
VASVNYDITLRLPRGGEVDLCDGVDWAALPTIRHSEELQIHFRPRAGRRISRNTKDLIVKKLINHRNRGIVEITTATGEIISSHNTYAYYLIKEPIRGKEFLFRHEGRTKISRNGDGSHDGLREQHIATYPATNKEHQHHPKVGTRGQDTILATLSKRLEKLDLHAAPEIWVE